MPKKAKRQQAADSGPENWPASRVELWPIDRIREYPKNPRTHSDAQIALIAHSMKEDGVTAPILVDEEGVIIAGHGRRLGALQNSFTQYPVVVARGWSEDRKRAVRIKDNQLAQLSGWDSNLLHDELLELRATGFDLPMLGFGEVHLAHFMAGPADDTPPESEIPPLPKNPITRHGDVWELGPHRILCGDCRDKKDVALLLDGASVNIAFTSPPYAEQRDYDESSGFKPIPPDDYVEWFESVASNVAGNLADDGSWFVNIKPSADGLDTNLYVFDLVLAHVRKWGWHFATEFCWERAGVPKSVTRRFKNQFEPVYQFARGDWKMRPQSVMHPSENGRGQPLGVGPTTASKLQGIPGAYGRDVKKRRGFPTGEGSQGTNWQANGNPQGIPIGEIGQGMAYPGNRLPTFTATHEATGHAAAFPVGLPAFFIKAYSDPSDAVYDPFLGSGSTLIAAHQNDRIGYGMELSSAYVDICVERWQRLTGGKAKRRKQK